MPKSHKPQQPLPRHSRARKQPKRRPAKSNQTKSSQTGLYLLLAACVVLLAGFGFWIITNNTSRTTETQNLTNETDQAGVQDPALAALADNDAPQIVPVVQKKAEGNTPEVKIDAAALTPKGATTFEGHIKPFLNKYCIDCHGPEKQKAKRRYDTLTFPIKDTDALVDYQDILDLINLAEMPPEDELQPSEDEKFKVINWMTEAIALAQKAKKSQGGETILRRMNRREYLATVGDLLKINMVGFDPTATFPDEIKEHHLDNQGHALLTSGYLLEQYIKAADIIIEKALPEDLSRPATKTWISDGPYKTRQFEGAAILEMKEKGIPPEHYNKLRRYNPRKDKKGNLKKKIIQEAKIPPARFDQMVQDARKLPSVLRLYEFPGSDRLSGAYGYMPEVANGVPADGYYDVSMTIQTMHRTNVSLPGKEGSDLSIPMIFAIVPGDKRLGLLEKSQLVEPILYKQDIWGDETYTDVKARVYLHKGQTPRFNWLNGGHDTRNNSVTWARRTMRKQKIPWFEKKPGYASLFVKWAAPRIRIPHMRLTDIQMRGPIAHDSDLATIKFLLGGTQFDASKNEANLRRILPEAFRRPVTSDEVQGVMQFIRSRENSGRSPYAAYKDGLKAVLCSPSFLYLEENPSDKGDISQEALASRLSFFLWSSMPDDQLMQKAKSGKLTSDAVLMQEVERMLSDPKSDRFVNGLLDGWLAIDQLNAVLPDSDDYRSFFTDDLPTLMREETVQFTRHILDTNQPIQDFIDCNYTFVNQQLANHYQLEAKVKGVEFRKVELAANSPRGGLLGQGSVLTVTANGVETSPVIRGIWLLENLLGTPPPPPPPDVEPLDPDIRGAKTMRERLQKHSTDPTCAECHRKIDPLGFALENFGPVGEFRTRYPKSEGGGKISAHGKMPNQKTFRGIRDFKKILINDADKFPRALTEKIFAYALGRPVEITDRPEIDAILADLKANGYGFKYLVKRIATSPSFKKS